MWFSPVHDKLLPKNLDGLLLYGGYPELYAEMLEKNNSMRKAVKEAIKGGMPCLAECGGFLYLHEELEDMEGTPHKMVGVIEGKAYHRKAWKIRLYFLKTAKGSAGRERTGRNSGS